MCVFILGSRRFSSVLAIGLSRLMGRQFLLMLMSMPGFRIGMIIALCRVGWKCPMMSSGMKRPLALFIAILKVTAACSAVLVSPDSASDSSQASA